MEKDEEVSAEKTQFSETEEIGETERSDLRKLNEWAALLLDTGKRNSLVNFKGAYAVEIVAPDFNTLFQKADKDACFDVYDPHTEPDDTDFYEEETFHAGDNGDVGVTRAEYCEKYAKKIKKSKQILPYQAGGKPVQALQNIAKRAKSAIEETGVNIAYMAFGLIDWYEEEEPLTVYRAPLLLTPVTVEQRSPAEPVTVKTVGDDTILNPTFAFKLHSEFGLELPDYEDDDIEEYFARVQEILAKLGWSLERACHIGVFSFLKINMYRDLKDNGELIVQNGIVRALLGEPPLPAPDSSEPSQSAPSAPPAPAESDEAELHNVVDADSSQSEAVAFAKTGKSFVLQGPPGTGKSQTITNLIAEFLHDGKKVLFVSEKLAALNVVYEKLKRAELDDFCLELHSYKANKRNFIRELCRTLKQPASAVSSRAAEHSRARRRTQDSLGAYERELHEERAVIRHSLYWLLSGISRLSDFPDCELTVSALQSKGEGYLKEAKDWLEQYAEYSSLLGEDYRACVWYGLRGIGDDAEQKRFLEYISIARETLFEIERGADRIESDFGVPLKSAIQAVSAAELLGFLGGSRYVTPALLERGALAAARKEAAALSALKQEITADRAYFDGAYEDGLYDLDAEEMLACLQEHDGFFSRMFNKKYKELCVRLQALRRDGKKPSHAEALEVVTRLKDYRKKTADFSVSKDALFSRLRGAGEIEDVKTELDALSVHVEQGGAANSFLRALAGLSKEEFERRRAAFTAAAEGVLKPYGIGKEAFGRVAKAFDPAVFDLDSSPFDAAKEKLGACLDGAYLLKNWLLMNGLLNGQPHAEIREFLDRALGNVPAEELSAAFEKAFYRQWAEAVVSQSPVLKELTRIPHDRAVALFAENDALQFEINKAEIRAKLSSQRPSTEMIAAGGAVSVLLREGEKKRKQKSIRTLLGEIPELIQRLKPCFLMSPLSVSTFLPAQKIDFDVVIFDEASQIFPQDAVGAIYRGKQVIVVGDSMQMPPSNFFNSVAEIAEEDDVTDFESILDLCSAVLPQRRLKWHYRSRYEQLIAFSNHSFYDGELVTFPSAKRDRRGIGVDFHYVQDGAFDRSGKYNRAEAEYVVDLIYRNIERNPERSMGVVAFSIAQQGVIERVLKRRRMREPALDGYFRLDKEEPFFIKNLETVQGDERDTVIFSVGYAKDGTGKFTHNFGPLNRAGGERRLNVAVTRAKYNVQLVSSIRQSDIDLNKTKSEGAKLLKAYLGYAENGEGYDGAGVAGALFDFEGGSLETEVGDFLREQGYCADLQVGCSDIKIDVGVRLPETDEYVLAIECDGAAYHALKTVRDRDRLRRETLERMGWRYYRLWSVDWYRDKEAEKQRLLEAVQEAIRNPPIAQEERTDDTAESFEEEAAIKFPQFEPYVSADIDALSRTYPYDFQLFVRAILEKESPLSESWLLKRICKLFGREKVTAPVIRNFQKKMNRCEQKGIERRDGFLYLQGKEITCLRIRGKEPREIKDVCTEELACGLLELLRLNVSCEREELFKQITKLLGLRLTDTARGCLEAALESLGSAVVAEGETLSLNG